MKKQTATNSPKVTRRPAEREVFVPFTADDERREELLTAIFDNGGKVDILEKSIKKLKDSAKPYQEAYENALTELKKGKPEKVMCWEFFNWADRKKLVRRQDNDDLVSEESITEDAVPLTLGDETVIE